jgi:hypothetical protein
MWVGNQEGCKQYHKEPANVYEKSALRKFFKIFWSNVVFNEELWRLAQQKPLGVLIKMQTWKRTGLSFWK